MQATFPVVMVRYGSAKWEKIFNIGIMISLFVIILMIGFFIAGVNNLFESGWFGQIFVRIFMYVFPLSSLLAFFCAVGARMNAEVPKKDYGKLRYEDGTEIKIDQMSVYDLQRLHLYTGQILHDRGRI